MKGCISWIKFLFPDPIKILDKISTEDVIDCADAKNLIFADAYNTIRNHLDKIKLMERHDDGFIFFPREAAYDLQ